MLYERTPKWGSDSSGEVTWKLAVVLHGADLSWKRAFDMKVMDLQRPFG